MSYLKWGVRKLSHPLDSCSYMGPIWQSVGIPPDLVPIGFHDQSEALLWAEVLSRHNLVGFEAFRLPD